MQLKEGRAASEGAQCHRSWGREGALPAGAERWGQGHLQDTRRSGPGERAAAVSPVGAPGSECSRGTLLPVESQSRKCEQAVPCLLLRPPWPTFQKEGAPAQSPTARAGGRQGKGAEGDRVGRAAGRLGRESVAGEGSERVRGVRPGTGARRGISEDAEH